MTGVLLLICAGFLTGYAESHKLSVRVEKLDAFFRFLSAAKSEIRYSSIPVESIVKKHGTELSFLKACTELGDAGYGWRSAWEAAIDEKAKDEGFSGSDLDLLKGFGEGFGASDTEGQLSHFDLYSELTAAALKNAREERNKKSKLYMMLGVSGGMVLAILLC